MIIEFISTPGAGKTSLLPVVKDYFNLHGYSAYTVIEAARPFAQRTFLGKLAGYLAPPALYRTLLWQIFYHYSRLYRIKFSRRHSILIHQVRSYQRRRPISRSDRQHVLHWFNHLTGCVEFFKKYSRRDEVIIFDEGFIHRVVQLFASEIEEPNPAEICAYIDLIPEPDLVISPQAPWEICEQRVYQRGIWERFRGRGPEKISRYIANSDCIVNTAVDYIKNKGWAVIELDNGGEDLTISSAELRRRLSTLLSMPADLQPELPNR